MPLETIEADQIIARGPCGLWNEEQVRADVPDPIEIWKLLSNESIPPRDRIWVATLKEFGPQKTYVEFARFCAFSARIAADTASAAYEAAIDGEEKSFRLFNRTPCARTAAEAAKWAEAAIDAVSDAACAADAAIEAAEWAAATTSAHRRADVGQPTAEGLCLRLAHLLRSSSSEDEGNTNG